MGEWFQLPYAPQPVKPMTDEEAINQVLDDATKIANAWAAERTTPAPIAQPSVFRRLWATATQLLGRAA